MNLRAPNQIYHPKFPAPEFLRFQARLVPYLITFLEDKFPELVEPWCAPEEVVQHEHTLPLISVFVFRSGESTPCYIHYNETMIAEFLSNFFSPRDPDFDWICELALDLIKESTKADAKQVMHWGIKGKLDPVKYEVEKIIPSFK